jgi:thioredoxin reductase (NADPH)
VTFVVPAVLGGIAIAVMLLVSSAASRRARREAAKPPAESRILVHSINDDRCTGCDACVAVCPTNVLDLLNNKSRVVRFQDCIQCEACMWACPTEALVMHPEGTQPPPLVMAELDANFQTAVPGQYLIGEVAGKPLVKNAANMGRGVVEHMLSEGLRPTAAPAGNGAAGAGSAPVDVLIVGSGPGGLSAALSCVQRGLSYLVVEKEQILASTVARYPKGKLVMAEPYDCENLSFLPVFDSSKEEIVPIWRDLAERMGLRVKLGETVEGVKPTGDGWFDVRTSVASYRAQRIVLATGLRGKPRTLGVPGESLPFVQSLLEDPDEWAGMPVTVVGGGDSALEAAMALADSGAKVLLSYRGRSFSRAQGKNKQAISSYAAQRRIKVKFQTEVVEFADGSLTLRYPDGTHKRYRCQGAFVLIGADPPVTWLEKLGVHFVERPHDYQLGPSDGFVRRLVADASECPRDAAAAAALVQGRPLPRPASPPPPPPRRAPTLLTPMPQRTNGGRKLIRSATSLFTSARQLSKPMPLSEFAKQSRHSGNGRRDSLTSAERTRVLRMLRDDGARIAHEDSQVYGLGTPNGVDEPPSADSVSYPETKSAARQQPPLPPRMARGSTPPPRHQPPPFRTPAGGPPNRTAAPLHLSEEDLNTIDLPESPREALIVGLAKVQPHRRRRPAELPEHLAPRNGEEPTRSRRPSSSPERVAYKPARRVQFDEPTRAVPPDYPNQLVGNSVRPSTFDEPTRAAAPVDSPQLSDEPFDEPTRAAPHQDASLWSRLPKRGRPARKINTLAEVEWDFED